MPMLVVSGGPKPGQVGVEGVNVVFRVALPSRLSILSDGCSSSRHANVKVTVLLSNMNSEICVPEVVVAGSPSGRATSVPELAFKNIEMLFEEPEKSAPVKSKR